MALDRAEGLLTFAVAHPEVYPDGETPSPRDRARDLMEAFIATDGVGATDWPRSGSTGGAGCRATSRRSGPSGSRCSRPRAHVPPGARPDDPGRRHRRRAATVVLAIEPNGRVELADILETADAAAGTHPLALIRTAGPGLAYVSCMRHPPNVPPDVHQGRLRRPTAGRTVVVMARPPPRARASGSARGWRTRTSCWPSPSSCRPSSSWSSTRPAWPCSLPPSSSSGDPVRRSSPGRRPGGATGLDTARLLVAVARRAVDERRRVDRRRCRWPCCTSRSWRWPRRSARGQVVVGSVAVAATCSSPGSCGWPCRPASSRRPGRSDGGRRPARRDPHRDHGRARRRHAAHGRDARARRRPGPDRDRPPAAAGPARWPRSRRSGGCSRQRPDHRRPRARSWTLLVDRFGYRYVSIYMVDGPDATRRAARLRRGHRDVRWHVGVVGRVMRTGEAELVRDISSDPDYAAASAGVRSEVSVPLAPATR